MKKMATLAELVIRLARESERQKIKIHNLKSKIKKLKKQLEEKQR